MSIYDKDLISGRDKVETAIARIKEFCGGKKTLVSFSGGKDSQCCYHLAKMAGVEFSAQYSITRFEPPELIDFIRDNYPDVTFRRAYKMSLVRQIEKLGLPNRWFRWCCDCKHKKTEGFDIAIIGIRFEESARRRARWRMFGQKEDKTYYVCPICDWSEDDVWEFLNTNGIAHCKLYDEGFKRIGCVCCPLSCAKMKSDAKRWPKVARMLEIGHRLNWEKYKASGFLTSKGKQLPMGRYSPEESFQFWLENGRLDMKRSDCEDDAQCVFEGSGFSERDGMEDEL